MSIPEPNEIKEMREKAQMELSELAKITSLSIPQLKQLESGGSHLFYSPEIKMQAIKRVLRVIDPLRAAELDGASAQPGESTVQSQESARPKNVIEEIVRLSNKGGRAKSILPSPVYTKKSPSAMAWGAGVIFIGIVILYISPWESNPQDSTTEIVIPVSKDSKEQINPYAVTDLTNLAKSTTPASETTTQVSDPIADSKNAIISSAKSTVDTSLNAVGSTLSRATDAVKSTAPMALPNGSPSPSKDAKDLKAEQKIVSVASTATTPTSSSPSAANSDSLPKTKPAELNNSINNSIDPCQLLGSDAPVTMSPAPTKAGNYVYFTTADKGIACVVDGTGKKSTVNVSKDRSMSVYGKGPWQIASPDFSKFQIYFQGTRVIPADNNGKRIQLLEQEIPQ